MVKHLLITGKSGIGKTTLIEKIITDLRQTLPKLKLSGFITKEVRLDGVRIGFNLCTLDGKEGVLARTSFNDNKHRKRVGKYFVDLKDLETIGVPSLQEEADLIILDEIGKMELLSHDFNECLENLLSGKTLLVATIAYYDTSETKNIKQLNSVKIIEVTGRNRDYLRKNIINHINSLEIG